MNITVYCSSRDNLPRSYVEMARACGAWIGSHGHRLVFGGCRAGLMHDVAQACHDAGGSVVGVITEGFRYRLDTIVDTEIVTPDLGHRKAKMIDLGRLFVVLPGGLGTLDEWLSTLSQLVVNNDYSRHIAVANPDGIYNATFDQLKQIASGPLASPQLLTLSHPCADTATLLATLSQLAHSNLP